MALRALQLVDVAARLGYATRVLAVVHHRSHEVQQRLLDLVREQLGCAARVVWAPRQVTQLLSTLGVLEAALTASPPVWSALLLLRYDVVLSQPLPLPPPSRLAAALIVPTLYYHGTPREKPDDLLHLVPWLALTWLDLA